jgi:hypothetical protein
MKISDIKKLIDEYELTHDNKMPTHILVSVWDESDLLVELSILERKSMYLFGVLHIERVPLISSKQIKKGEAICVSSK